MGVYSVRFSDRQVDIIAASREDAIKKAYSFDTFEQCTDVDDVLDTF